MATWDSADLLARCKRYANRPAVDESFSDEDWYALLTEAQQEAVQDIVTRVPNAMTGAPVQLTSSDGGVTYSFGVGVQPLGHIELYTDEDGSELVASSWADAEGDFVVEGSTIRMPANLARTFTSGGGPYARFVTMPTELSASTEPTLKPEWARALLVFGALIKWASIGGLRDPSDWEKQYAALFAKVCLSLKTQYKNRNAPARVIGGRPWWERLSRNR